jgi:hypothetical protein
MTAAYSFTKLKAGYTIYFVIIFNRIERLRGIICNFITEAIRNNKGMQIINN